MRVLYAYLCVFARIYSICVFCTHIYACFVRIYTRLKDTYIYAFKVFGEKYIYIGLEPIYHEPIFKQMASHITLGNGFVNRDSTYPSSKIR